MITGFCTTGFNATLGTVLDLFQLFVLLAHKKSVVKALVAVAMIGVLFLCTDVLEVVIGVTLMQRSQLFPMNTCTSLCNLDSPSSFWAQLPQ